MIEQSYCIKNNIGISYGMVNWFIQSKFDVVNIDYNKEMCNFTIYINFLGITVKIPFGFWEITSIYIGNRIYEKIDSLFRILEKSKIFWVRKKFSIKKLIRLRYKEISKISKFVIYNLSKFLNCCGSIFFTKFFNNLKVILIKLFVTNRIAKKKTKSNQLGRFLGLFFCNLYHYHNVLLFLKLNNTSLIISHIWYTMKLCNQKKRPWWRKLKTRECELEYFSKESIFNICSTSKRCMFKLY